MEMSVGRQPKGGGLSTARCFAVRHATTAWNDEGRYQSRTDVPLVGGERTEGEVEAIASHLVGERVDRIWVSPASRAATTGRLVASRIGVGSSDVRVEHNLRELDFGAFEGMTGEELEGGDWADAYRAWRGADGSSPPAPGGEPWGVAAGRARAVLQRVLAVDGSTLVVGHSYLLRLMVTTILPGVPPQGLRLLTWHNAGLTELRYDDRWVLVRHNV